MREKLAKYEQIRQDIIHKIESMEYRPNQVIPSENELCASYGVSRITVQLSFTKARQVLNATVGSSEIYGYLETEENQPLLRINATSFCLYHDNETVFEIYESYILTDILSYYVEKYNT